MSFKDELGSFSRQWPNDLKRIALLQYLRKTGKPVLLREIAHGLDKSAEETASVLFPAIKDGLVELKGTSRGELATITPLGQKVLQSVRKSQAY